ncbi:lactonase family protein [Flavobacterium sp. ANB]|uniref:lactonase family protein n=1 Tax=unclassified Flavobacterium TaxID=196869 RepID=UPI0012B86A96|nr:MULTISPECIES: lactonase family protein [unclassified Flavobacterium]MBF4516486.1 lactonase family protein [Flavobacterium sp. ANB]MTD69617.1 beta-propeller fold lactonase family protein [Flavobacterium sp. LC2016-13]
MKRLSILLFSALAFTTSQAQNKFNLLVGTYTNTCESKGIYVYEFNAASGDFKLKNSTENVVSPSYLSASANNKFIYAVNENGTQSALSAFGYDSKTGKLKLLNSNATLGADPCHLINDDKNVIVANYSGGSIAVFKKNADGSITEVQQLIQHEGKGPNAARQEKAHVHMVVFSPDKTFILSNDLGQDKIFIYKYNASDKHDILTLKGTVDVKAGSGPRHLTFSKDGKFVYLLQELDGTLTTFAYDKTGNLKLLKETNIIPKDFKGANSSAAIKISPDGGFLYVSDRGDVNAISVYQILKDGSIKLVEQESTLGKGPRDFVIDPTGNYLLVGHQYTNDIIIFKRDKTTGKLTNTGKKIELCSPVGLLFTKI